MICHWYIRLSFLDERGLIRVVAGSLPSRQQSSNPFSRPDTDSGWRSQGSCYVALCVKAADDTGEFSTRTTSFDFTTEQYSNNIIGPRLRQLLRPLSGSGQEAASGVATGWYIRLLFLDEDRYEKSDWQPVQQAIQLTLFTTRRRLRGR